MLFCSQLNFICVVWSDFLGNEPAMLMTSMERKGDKEGVRPALFPLHLQPLRAVQLWMRQVGQGQGPWGRAYACSLSALG